MTRHTRTLTLFAAVAIASLGLAGCGTSSPSSSPAAGNPAAPAASITRGGTLTVSVRAEPRSFSRIVARDSTTDLLTNLTQAKLVRINKVTQEVEPWLAESWTRSDDARRYTLTLRPDVVFSDGQPFTSADVVFTFKAIYDEKTGSNLADSLTANGKKLQVAALDPRTVEIVFAEPFAAGVRLLNNLPILPRHKLQAALDAGQLGNAWNLSTPPSEIVGLGPFVLSAYVPGQRIVFDRNPRYFRKAPDGGALPYLDHLTIEIVPDQNAELLRLEAGQTDMSSTESRPNHARHSARRRRRTNPAVRSRRRPRRQQLLVQPQARRVRARPPRRVAAARRAAPAISLAVDRQLLADTVYLGAAVPSTGRLLRPTSGGTGTACRRLRTIRRPRKRGSPPSVSPIRMATGCSKTSAIIRSSSR